MISIFEKIFKNTLWLTLAEIADKGLLFILVVMMARYLGADNYGKFGFAINFVTLFSIIAGFGLNTYITREIAKYKEKIKKYLDNLIAIKILLAILTIILAITVTLFLGKSREVKNLVFILMVYIVAVKFSEFFHGIFRAHEEMKYEALIK
jgi:O-antigen/teichoic acid export membrane protein